MNKPEYAKGTSVPAHKTQGEIRQLVSRHGCAEYAIMERADLARVQFKSHGRLVRFDLPMPDMTAKRFTLDAYSRRLPPQRAAEKWDDEVKRLWRCLLLAIKSKFEVVATGMAVFEQEFLAHIVMPDGKTVGEHVQPAIADSYATGQVKGLLPEPGKTA